MSSFLINRGPACRFIFPEVAFEFQLHLAFAMDTYDLFTFLIYLVLHGLKRDSPEEEVCAWITDLYLLISLPLLKLYIVDLDLDVILF